MRYTHNLTEKKRVLPLDGPYIQYQNKKMLNFSSSDLLGLAQHPDVKKNAIKYTLKLGVKTVGASLESLMQTQVEEKLAQILSVEKCHFFHSLESALHALSKTFANHAVFSDTSHAFFPQETLFENCASLKKLSKGKTTALILVKSSHKELDQLVSFAQEQGAVVCIDHSDTFGITGKRGIGILPKERKDVVILGSFEDVGGFSTGYVGSSSMGTNGDSLSPAILGAIDALLNLSPEMDHEREQIKHHTSWLEKQLQERGFSHFSSSFATTTLSLTSEEEAEKLWNAFSLDEIFVGQPSSSQISLTMTALHTPDDLDQLSCVLKKLSATDFALVTQSLTPTPQR